MAKATKTAKKSSSTGKITNVKIRMYCLGTGDCFILSFCSGATVRFTMMIDCGSCQGGPAEFKPYIQDLASYVKNNIDLLVVTHEHNDHVNGFAKCADIFSADAFKIKEAWFAWTEDPEDPDGRAKDLQEKRNKLRLALSKAMVRFQGDANLFNLTVSDDFAKPDIVKSNAAFMEGLNTLAEINLPAAAEAGKPLAGMTKIREILEQKKSKIKYLNPGQTLTLSRLPGLKFHILGPPSDRTQIFKEGKQGTDVYKKKLNLSENALAANAFTSLQNTDSQDKDLPFDDKYLADDPKPSINSKFTKSQDQKIGHFTAIKAIYDHNDDKWRKIDMDWLSSAGSLALRLNSHINNTSLAMAIEDEGSRKVVLLPGDAEFGSWESWHDIAKWNKKGPDGKHFVEDLLNRTVFYKVGHHLSYNGTALEKGIAMMESTELAAMATLDRQRIAVKWKTTMPNTYLMAELIRKCEGRLFIMSEFDIKDGPSKQLDPTDLGKNVYQEEKLAGKKGAMYKQYTVKF